MSLLQQMMEQSKAAVEELDSALARVSSTQSSAEDMMEHVGEIGTETLVNATQAILTACEEAQVNLVGAREAVMHVAFAVQNAGGEE